METRRQGEGGIGDKREVKSDFTSICSAVFYTYQTYNVHDNEYLLKPTLKRFLLHAGIEIIICISAVLILLVDIQFHFVH